MDGYRQVRRASGSPGPSPPRGSTRAALALVGVPVFLLALCVPLAFVGLSAAGLRRWGGAPEAGAEFGLHFVRGQGARALALGRLGGEGRLHGDHHQFLLQDEEEEEGGHGEEGGGHGLDDAGAEADGGGGRLALLAHDFEGGAPLPPARGVPATLAFTFSAWVRLGHVASSRRCLAAQPGRWELAVLPSGNLELRAALGGPGGGAHAPPLWFETPLGLAAGRWANVAVAYDSPAGEAFFYVGGALVPHAAAAEPPPGAHAGLPLGDADLLLGRCEAPPRAGRRERGPPPEGARLLTGAVADARLHDGALRPAAAGPAAALAPGAPPSVPAVLAALRAEAGGEIFSMERQAAAGDEGWRLAAAAVPAPAAAGAAGAAGAGPFAAGLSAYSACSVPAPSDTALHNVAKPASLTLMVWAKLDDLPRRGEACLLSHGSYDAGWKLSILSYGNLQLTVRTRGGAVLDFFSAPVTPAPSWQHVAVTYDAADARVQWLWNGFPLDEDFSPPPPPSRERGVVAEPAPLVVGRCALGGRAAAGEPLAGVLADVMVWDAPLDFGAVRALLRGAGAGDVSRLRRALPGARLVFSLPPAGCRNASGPLPALPRSMQPPPPPPLPPSGGRERMQGLLLSAAVVLHAHGADLGPALRVLDAVDAQAAPLLAGGRFGAVPAVIVHTPPLAGDSSGEGGEAAAAEWDPAEAEGRYARLEVSVRRVATDAGGDADNPSGAGILQTAAAAVEAAAADRAAAAAAAGAPPPPPLAWALLLNEHLKPLEHWLEHLLAATLGDGSSSAPPPLAVKSLTLGAGGVVKSAGLRHYLTVVGDGLVVPAPFHAWRGYKASYLRGLGPAALAAGAEAASCESLLVAAPALAAAAAEVPDAAAPLHACARLTAPAARARRLALAAHSWVLEHKRPGARRAASRWDAGAESMALAHEQRKRSLLAYAAAEGAAAMAAINAGLAHGVTVRWMFACGGSWAWEAANLVEHLERRLPLRVQMQNPFKYCGGHNVLAAAPLSFAERVERMVELPALPVARAPGGGFKYRTPLPRGTAFEQDDIVIYHRDYFRASNWHNSAVRRPLYAIGRYMNEVTGLHARLVQQCNELDEVWVPSAHHVGVFADAGVDRAKLVVIPESIDPLVFDPATVEPMILPGRRRFVFISVFKFEDRKNWKQLLWAFHKAFSDADDVTLTVHTNWRGKFDGASNAAVVHAIESFIQKSVLDGSTQHRDNSTLPHWAITGKPLSTEAMIGLYKAADCYVLPTHGEGWGLPYMEAMAMGLPTIATAWGGNTEFMNANNSLLVRVKGFEPTDPYDDWLKNFHWATPDEAHLAQLMAEVYFNPGKAARLGAQARADVSRRFSNAAVAALIEARLAEVAALVGNRTADPPQVGYDYALWTVAADVKLCMSMPQAPPRRAAVRPQAAAADADADAAPPPPPLPLPAGVEYFGGAAEVACPAAPARVAFLTPFPPRADGLAAHAASLRAAAARLCPGVRLDVFAVVMDFFSGYSEPYNTTHAARVVHRESAVDYAAAAAEINSNYDAAVVNFKLGALGGTSAAYALCFARQLAVPLVTLVHSVHANMDDALQLTLQQLVAASTRAGVFSHRARLALDTAAGLVPAPGAALRPAGVVALPHGAPARPPPARRLKDAAKERLGLGGRTVLLTAGLMRPDKGVDHALRGLAALPAAARARVAYLVAGAPADCGAACVELYGGLRALAAELGVADAVVFMPGALGADAWTAAWTAADAAMLLVPEDLVPHPACFYEALAHGAVPVATPFAAALAHMDEASGFLVGERDPARVAAALGALLALPPRALAAMQRAGWAAAQGFTWDRAAAAFLRDALLPAMAAGGGCGGGGA